MLLSVCISGSAYGWSTNFEIYSRDNKPKKKGTGNDDTHSQANKIEFIMKNVKVHSLGYDEEYDLLFVSSSDYKLTIFSTEGGKGCKNYMQISTGAPDIELTSLLLAKQQSVLFAGTNKGSVRVYLWPMLKRKQTNIIQSSLDASSSQFANFEYQCDFMEYYIHVGKVVNLSLSADKQSLVSCSEDGTVYISSIKEICNGIDMNLNVSLLAVSTSQQH